MDPLLTTQQSADFLNLSARTLERRRRSGASPVWVLLPPRSIRYRPADLLDWIEQHLQTKARDERPAEVAS